VTFTPPEQLGKWLRQHRLGNGAFGDAWVFEDSSAKNEYAVIKFLTQSQESITVTKKRFKKERDILSKLNNPRVCRLLDDDLDSNPPWIATELFGGRPLKSEITESYQLDEFTWVRLANDVLEGLTYVHSLKIKHRDLNPGNIVSTAAGYRIIDFGISSQGQAQGTYSGNQRIFHRLYGSPELYDENKVIDEKSDVFSLATLLVFAATHKSPWTTDARVSSDREVTQGIFQEVAYNIQKSEPQYYGMSTNQRILLRKMHEKNPSNRPSAEEALKELKKLSDKEFVNYLAAGAPKRPSKSAPVKVAPQNIKDADPKKSPKIVISPRVNLSKEESKALKKESSHRQQMLIKIIDSEFGHDALASDFPQRAAVKKMLTVLDLLTTEEMEDVSRQVNAKLGWEFIKNLSSTTEAPNKTPISKTKLAISTNRVQVVVGWASVDPANLSISGDSVQVDAQAWPAPKPKETGPRNPGNIASFLQIYWKDLLIGWLTTPVGWLIYRAYKKRNAPSEDSSENTAISLKGWKIGYLVTHGISFGFLGPVVGIPFAFHLKSKAVSVFMAINSIAVFTFFSAIASTPSGSEVATYATVVWVLNYIFGFFLPLAMRRGKVADQVQSPEPSNQLPSTYLAEGEKIDPFDDEEYFANAQAKLKKEPVQQTWLLLGDEVTKILNHSGIENFNVTFAQKDIEGIYFQGFREKSGCITIEAASSLSVRPEVTSEQNRNIIRSGWEPPAGENPNYVKFLDLTQSNLEFISSLIISTLRDGYGVDLVGLQPVFSVSMGGEIIYVDFEEFKRLTS